MADFKHKPEAVQASASSGGAGSSKSQITNQMQMSLDEAHLILNVKKDDPMEIIQKVRGVWLLRRVGRQRVRSLYRRVERGLVYSLLGELVGEYVTRR